MQFLSAAANLIYIRCVYLRETSVFVCGGGGPNYAIPRNYILSATRSDASREMGSILWINTELAMLQYLLSVAI